MICGIGVDLVEMHQFSDQLARLQDTVINRLFTIYEQTEAGHRADPVMFLAGRFAAKEAVYKAVRNTIGTSVDLRKIEIQAHEDGSPYVHPSEVLSEQLACAGICSVQVSISNEKDYVIAFAVAETK